MASIGACSRDAQVTWQVPPELHQGLSQLILPTFSSVRLLIMDIFFCLLNEEIQALI